jgi:hypothetical protein
VQLLLGLGADDRLAPEERRGIELVQVLGELLVAGPRGRGDQEQESDREAEESQVSDERRGRPFRMSQAEPMAIEMGLSIPRGSVLQRDRRSSGWAGLFLVPGST